MNLLLVLHCLLVPAQSRAASYHYDYNHTLVGSLQSTTAQEDDTLIDIAREFALGYEEIIQANPDLDPWLPGGGSRVILPSQFILPQQAGPGVYINLAEMRLYYYEAAEQSSQPGGRKKVSTYPISIGREEWRTPIAGTHIVDKLVQPTWYPPESIRLEHEQNGDPLPRAVPPGADNPLGEYALQLDLPGYFIHGTNRPEGVGMRVTHGCIRLRPEDIGDLFPQVVKGTKVTIRFTPHKIALVDGVIYFEAHQGGYDRHNQALLAESLIQVSRLSKEHNIGVDWERMIRIAKRGRGIPEPLNIGMRPQVAEIRLRSIKPHTPRHYIF